MDRGTVITPISQVMVQKSSQFPFEKKISLTEHLPAHGVYLVKECLREVSEMMESVSLLLMLNL